MAQDPSSTVPPDLMPHVHLVSSFRYPSMPGLDLKDVAKFLMNAPLIARDKAPFFWTYLDRPADGTTLMTWQPLGRLSTNFATDGFVWAPPEQIYKHDLGNGLLLEIYFLKAGYIPGEQVAAHARRRFRLVPGPNHPNPASVDTSLFIVHYGPSDPNERIPANAIPYDERVNTIMQQRHFLQRAGQIRRKEFMLSDRANWPSLPELARQHGPPQMGPRGVPQQMAYPPQPAGPPAKRARHSQAGPGQQQPPPGAAHPDPFDDDEDVYRGDMFDHLTPREVSYSRYQQNHEWMEEILSSPYRAGQITPADLGIGLKGELASLTEGIFASQGVDAFAVPAAKSYTGKLDAGEADKFKERVGQYIESTNAELEKMKEEHAKALQEFRESGSMRAKERELRAVLEETGPEVWRIEGRVDPTEDDGAVAVKPSKQTIDDIVKDVEASLGQKIESKAKIDRVAAGGWQEPPPEPEPEPEPEVPAAAAEAEDAGRPSQAGSQSDLLMEGGDMDMGDDTAGGLLDQMHTGFSSTSTPNNNFPTPGAGLSAGQSAAGTPNPSAPSPAPAAAPQAASDVQMGGTEAKAGEGETAPDQGTGSGDWVVVPKEGDAAGPGAVSGAPGAAPAPGPDAQQQHHQAPKPASTEQSAKATPIGGTPGGSGSFDQNDFGSIDDLNTAGDAMSGFDDGGDDLQMDMEDSAFGDAFHGVGDDGTPGGEGM